MFTPRHSSLSCSEVFISPRQRRRCPDMRRLEALLVRLLKFGADHQLPRCLAPGFDACLSAKVLAPECGTGVPAGAARHDVGRLLACLGTQLLILTPGSQTMGYSLGRRRSPGDSELEFVDAWYG